ncbi:MAG: LemA family protein [Acidimicrobiales bacterium]|nr:LemA family protein [Acidimicrobiales bacterium]
MWLLISLALAVLFGVMSLSAWRKKWAIDDTPTSKCRGVFVGRNEVVGTAEALYEPLRAPFTQTPCVWFSWELEEYKKQGDDSSWVTIEKRSTAAPFWIADETGKVLVRPRMAKLGPRQSIQERIGTGFNPPYSLWQLRQWVLVGEDNLERHYSLQDRSFSEPPHHKSGLFDFKVDSASPISNLPGKKRITEHVIEVGSPLYLFGTARPRMEGPGLEFVGGEEELIVTTKSEAQVAKSAKFAAFGLGLACMVLSGFFVGGISTSMHDEVRWGWVVGVALAELFILFLLVLQRNYNRQIEVKEQAAKAWSLIDVSLQRRSELVPKLVAVVEEFNAHELRVQELVAELRSIPAPPPSVEKLPDDATISGAESTDLAQRHAASSTVALAEAYPELKASEVFLDLQHRYADAEEAVATARSFYNDSIEVLRTRRSQFPGSLFARLVEVPSWRLFEADLAASYVAPAAVAPDSAPAPSLDKQPDAVDDPRDVELPGPPTPPTPPNLPSPPGSGGLPDSPPSGPLRPF